MEAIALPLVILVVWLIMAKGTKKSIGNTVTGVAHYGNEFVAVQRKLQLVSATAEIKETQDESGVTAEEVEAFRKSLELGK